MSNVETLVAKIRERQDPLRELLGLLGELAELAQPTLVTPDALAALQRAVTMVREAKAAVLQHRRAVEDADSELDHLMDKAGVPAAKVTKTQERLESLRGNLDLAERRAKAALRAQDEAADETRRTLHERHKQQRAVSHILMREFGPHLPGKNLPEGTFRHVLEEIMTACDTIGRRALTYDAHTWATDEIETAVQAALEPPFQESAHQQQEALAHAG